MAVTVLGVTGGTGANGAFQIGDRPVLTFRATKTDGTNWLLEEMDRVAVMLSGPTTGYQLVIAPQSDARTASARAADGTYAYMLPALPAVYPPPFNDSTSFGAADGELAAQPLVDGTYTIGVEMFRTYNVAGNVVREAATQVAHILVGAATALEPREVVGDANCVQCHTKVVAHGGTRTDVSYCVLCHTAGAEDRNNAAVANGTPGVSIAFDVMIHKIHNAQHLPSVVGVATDVLGARDYSVTPSPLLYVGFEDRVFDMSGVGFPVMPSAYTAYLFSQDGSTYTGTGGNGPMPRDVGYAALPATNKQKEDTVRSGVVSCFKCHGDPDGTGPLAAPANGDRAYNAPTMRACGSCHDDVDYTRPYVSNGLTMDANPTAASCATCHPAQGTAMAVMSSHQHPYDNPVVNRGLNVAITNAAGPAPGNVQQGDVISVTFGVTDGANAPFSLHNISRFQFMVVGPTTNPQVVAPAVLPFDNAWRKSTPFTGNGTASKPVLAGGAVAETVAVAFDSATAFTVIGSVSPATAFTLGGAAGNNVDVTFGAISFRVTQGSTLFAAGDRFYFEVIPVAASYTMPVPFDVPFELVGRATGAAQTTNVANLPLNWGRQTVWERTAINPGATLGAPAAAYERVVVVDAAVLNVAVGDRVVIDDGLPTEEYAQVGRIQTTDDFLVGLDLFGNDRVYFTTALRFAHGVGANIQKVTLTSRREGIHYTVTNTTTGEITLAAGSFGSNNPVVVSYRTSARFGWRRSSVDALQAVYQPAAADSPEIGAEWGDWVGARMLPGTYTVGAWAHVDFTVTPQRAAAAVTRAWNDISVDDTTYRTISPPATLPFLYGPGPVTVEPRSIIPSGEACNRCHDTVQAHGNGRMGLDTCLMCHTTPGMEDGPKFTFAAWYTGATPAVTMDFRSLLHKVHMGKELSKKDEFSMVGVFLGVPYTVTLEEKGFTAQPGGVRQCTSCHGNNPAWQSPPARRHPDQATGARVWAAACNSCHDSDAAAAHANINTYLGWESCETCHGPGREFSVELVHKVP